MTRRLTPKDPQETTNDESTADQPLPRQRRSSTSSVTSHDDEAMSRAVILDPNETQKQLKTMDVQKRSPRASMDSWEYVISEAKKGPSEGDVKSDRYPGRASREAECEWTVIDLQDKPEPRKEAPKEEPKGYVSSLVSWFNGGGGHKK